MKTITKNLKNVKSIITLALVMLVSINVSAQDASNKNNPYDYIGQIHNELLESYNEKHKDSKKNVRETYNIFNNLLRENSTANKISIDFQNVTEKNIEILENGTFHFKDDFRSLIQNLNISETAKKEITEIKDYILKTCLNEKIGFEAFYKYAINNENRIMGTRKLTTSEKELILGAYSTARYSYVYWNKNNEKSNNKKSFWGVLLVIGGDVAGWFGTGSMDGAGAASELIGDALDGGK